MPATLRPIPRGVVCRQADLSVCLRADLHEAKIAREIDSRRSVVG
jgi:hypothetical protein